MNIQIEDIPFTATKWEVKRAFAKVLHGPEFAQPGDARRTNFDVKLEPSLNGLPSNGKGTLTIPDPHLGEQFFRWALNPYHNVKVEHRALNDRGDERIFFKKLYLRRSKEKPPHWLVRTLNKTPYLEPEVQAEREEKLWRIGQIRILLDAIQFGVFFRRPEDPRTANRSFSNEYEIRGSDTFAGELLYDYDHKLLRVEMGDSVSSDIVDHIVVDLDNVRKSAYGSDPTGQYYICLELWSPPRFERQPRLRYYSGERRKDRQFRERLPHLGGLHEQITQYAYHLRLVLTDPKARRDLRVLYEQGGIHLPAKANIDVTCEDFFVPERMAGVRQWILGFEWPVSFQLEAMLLNGYINTGDLFNIRLDIEQLVCDRPTLAADFLRRFSEKLKSTSGANAILQSFRSRLDAELKDADRLAEQMESDSYRPHRSFSCPHVIVTPTRIVLEGPYDTQSNRIVRRYYDYREYFVRVEFREENRMSFRWPLEVSGRSLMEQRFGRVLKEGLEVAGRLFRFLGYSTSGLREHTAWFMADFEHPDEGLVTAEKIRGDLGDFSGCIRIPSKYAARIAQAFSGTDPSVRIKRAQWDMVEDLGKEPYQHTDGQGVISKGLRDRIWDVLTETWPDRNKLILKPSAYQIRFLGFKGVVVVDEQLEGECMRLRPSMNKYTAKDQEEAEIEIAKAFIHPGTARLCRPLIAVLEDRGVEIDAFMKLQNDAKEVVATASDSIEDTVELLRKHDLGNVFGIRHLLQHLANAGMGMKKMKKEAVPPKPRPDNGDAGMEMPSVTELDNEFIRRLIRFAQTHLLREIKHDARIPIKDAHQLVGVVDEGPRWEADGVENVFCLNEWEIFACVQKPDSDEPVWITGIVSISRSPHIHPGDVQRVKAIGKPPDGVPCFFRDLRNVVVMPSRGERSLASCLAGGDVDGDEFLVIKDSGLLPTEYAEPADYKGVKPEKLERDSTVIDICNFFVEYMQSDVVGLVADQHLIIADQSKYGTYDRDCMKLAELCSQAVDYPKNGVPVDTEQIPRRIIHAKPDWKKTEDDDPRPADFYESTRALGNLFRNIKIKDDALSSSYPNGAPLTPVRERPLSDKISVTLQPEIERHLGRFKNNETAVEDIEPLFGAYARELSYVCMTHAPTENADVRLSEEEVVIGVIMAKCSNNRWRKSRMHRMREHVAQIVRDIKHRKRGLGAPQVKDGELPAREELRAALAKAWNAWDFGMRNRHVFGSKSFAIIALGVVCDMLDMLKKLEKESSGASVAAESH